MEHTRFGRLATTQPDSPIDKQDGDDQRHYPGLHSTVLHFGSFPTKIYSMSRFRANQVLQAEVRGPKMWVRWSTFVG